MNKKLFEKTDRLTLVHEEAWNAFPYCKTVLTNPGIGKRFFIIIESFHANGKPEEENALELTEELLKQRQIVYIDIGNDCVDRSDYKVEEDPKLYRSQKLKRGPLTDDNWIGNIRPIMTCYKLVQVQFQCLGMQNRIEEWVQRSEQRLFLNFHRNMFCTMDEWAGLSINDIRKLEDELANEMNSLQHKDSVSNKSNKNNNSNNKSNNKSNKI